MFGHGIEQEAMLVIIAVWRLRGRLGPCSCADRRICIRLKCPDARRWLSALTTSRKTYVLTICSAEVLARWLQLIPLLHSILRSPIFMLTRSTSLPLTVTIFDYVKVAGALSAEVKTLGDFQHSVTTSCLQLGVWCDQLLQSCDWRATVLCWTCSFCCYSTVKAIASFVTVVSEIRKPCFCLHVRCNLHNISA